MVMQITFSIYFPNYLTIIKFRVSTVCAFYEIVSHLLCEYSCCNLTGIEIVPEVFV